MATMPSPSQNTICIGTEKTNIRVVSPSGKGKGMLIPQKKGETWFPTKNILSKPVGSIKYFSFCLCK